MKRPRNPPQINDMMTRIELDRVTEMLIGGRIEVAPGGRYHHWDQLRHRPPRVDSRRRSGGWVSRWPNGRGAGPSP